MSSTDRPVFVTGLGRIPTCRRCGEPVERCRCRERGAESGRPGVPRDGWVRVARESKGRNGKPVTLVHGLPEAGADLAALAKTLKQLCATGGTAADGVIVLQGEHREKVQAKLSSLGFKVKRVGA
jgi:translation initiation factor 1